MGDLTFTEQVKIAREDLRVTLIDYIKSIADTDIHYGSKFWDILLRYLEGAEKLIIIPEVYPEQPMTTIQAVRWMLCDPGKNICVNNQGYIHHADNVGNILYFGSSSLVWHDHLRHMEGEAPWKQISSVEAEQRIENIKRFQEKNNTGS